MLTMKAPRTPERSTKQAAPQRFSNNRANRGLTNMLYQLDTLLENNAYSMTDTRHYTTGV
jgi:hypothetical protein